ncbi:hypothetical protein PR048_017829 [Dryococelus australis]|uniref:EF-hand domain-containing protein n=1 Tax=Dryococelus australis TaxID=614101 RepID=A0ABQ9HB67_9NEOP|nr:hypothetical protein PR048_017829 [Dryococelus australis]
MIEVCVLAVLRKAFDSFDREKLGSIPCNMVEEILRLMGQPFNRKILEELIDEVDADSECLASAPLPQGACCQNSETHTPHRILPNKKFTSELWYKLSSESGRLEFEEFITLAAKFIVEEDAEAMEKELREAFRLYDKEGNGYIPTTCLREILRELDDQLTEQELDMMIEEIDADGSGTVDFDVVRKLASHLGEPGSSPEGAAPLSSNGESCRKMPLAGGLSLPFPPPLHSGAIPRSSHFTFIGSQDLVVKGRPNLFTSLYKLDYFFKHHERILWYADNNVRLLDWPAQRPDLDTVEHIWDELDRRVRARQARPKSVGQLMELLQEEWRRIPMYVLQTLV